MPLPRTVLSVLAASGALLMPGAARAAVSPALPAGMVQERLVRLGLLPDEARSGRFDRRTADAVARFQARAGPLRWTECRRSARPTRCWPGPAARPTRG